jgi:argininosuccinate lyase
VPFRTAHHIVGGLVAMAEAGGVQLAELPDAAFAAALREAGDDVARRLADDAAIAADLRAASTVEAAVSGPDVVGGTAPGRVAAALAAARERLGSV